ncbi:hypothetical protein [Pseudomonas saliphila]|uniref:hypothetical protein n=1 Tax=Pseudomonas saliphila TaxID=2586906 RepID=UPI001239F759|nr:hypothetical protein [Pseudomonas saliphila]
MSASCWVRLGADHYDGKPIRALVIIIGPSEIFEALGGWSFRAISRIAGNSLAHISRQLQAKHLYNAAPTECSADPSSRSPQ